MAEYSRLAKGNFTATGTTAVINLPFTPDYVELWNYTNIKTAATHSMVRAWWDNKLLDGSNNSTMIELYSGSSTSTVYDIISNTSSNLGINAFSAGQLLQFGPSQQIVSATAANPAVFTVTGHGYQVGDTVLLEGLFQTSTTGMPQMAGIPFTISAVTTNTFTVKWNASGSNYTALSASPVGSTVKKILFPNLYFPGTTFISALTLAATTTVVTTSSHQYQVGQEVAFRIPSTWGPTGLNSLPNTVVPGSPIYGYVTSVTDQWTFVVNINSTGFTAFNPNQTVSGTPGRSFAQVVAAGDVNTGGVQISAGSALYPSPLYSVGSLNSTSTINGPAIIGSFVNNTSQGFTIGAGTAATDGTATLIANGNLIYWHAYSHDIGLP
jgi:hypothetical protein